MRSPKQAIAEILGCVSSVRDEELVPLAESDGRVLARAATSDLDLPPFEKSAVDGYAVRSADIEASSVSGDARAERRLPILGESRAGAPFGRELASRACVAIYTGAELPAGADAVIMLEDVRVDGDAIVFRERVRVGQNVCHRGQDLHLGDTVLLAGRRLRPADLAVLASVGCDPVPVFRRPRVALLTTGDELVPPSARPGPGEIRESNTLELAALARRAGAHVENLGVVKDEPAELERRLADALERCDALVTTGGVSVGKYDYVHATLAKLGVREIFHKIAMKPGKPLWFGLAGAKPVFALPGNPVSCFVGFELFVGPALARMGQDSGLERAARVRRGRWRGAELAPNPREQYVPCTLDEDAQGVVELAPVRWNGSADVVGLARAEALAVAPIETRVAPGEMVEYRLLP
ncbi:MAG: molybdopterin molybdotransferase MoeA [Planctomycetes bacterium]|nr:molybdopterin molybdotransferase MoeA [Planctomycetota bacterium]